jgi:hypothetical protein
MMNSLNVSDMNLSLTEDTNEIDGCSYKDIPSAQQSGILSPITEMASIMPTSPEDSDIFAVNCDFDDLVPDTFGKSRKSFEIINSGCGANTRMFDSGESGFMAEPEGEKSLVPFTREIQDTDPLYEWLTRLNLQYLYNVLVDSGYDDVESMIDQMRSPLPITQETLMSIGLEKPGHAIRLVIRLEEEAGVVQARTKRRNIS